MKLGDKKLFLGGRLKRLRRELGLTQSRMAEDLDVSPSYLNHLERNQRPVTAQVLLRLAEAYDLDLRALSAEQDHAAEADLAEVFADLLFRDLAIPRHEIAELAHASPGVADAIVRLYQSWSGLRRAPTALTEEAAELAVTPADWVRDYVQAQRNWWPELDDAGETIAAELPAEDASEVFFALRDRLKSKHGVGVRTVPAEVLPESTRRYDHHRRRLMLSELLGASGRTFAVAYQLALIEGAELLAAALERAAPPDAPTRRLLKVTLANTLAAAILMPYGRFREAAESSGYDLGLLKARFGVSFEQACHRLTTLSRPSARGVPFFMMRVDHAGNVSKRFAGGAYPFSRFGGACPRWNVHASFRSPGRILTQVVETPDGQRWFTLARTVKRSAAVAGVDGDDLAVGLGCELKHAAKLVYAQGLDPARPPVTAIGPTCRLCPRVGCPQRAAPPVDRTLMVDDFSKSISPYPFSPHG